jgi:hypothetical protein
MPAGLSRPAKKHALRAYWCAAFGSAELATSSHVQKKKGAVDLG